MRDGPLLRGYRDAVPLRRRTVAFRKTFWRSELAMRLGAAHSQEWLCYVRARRSAGTAMRLGTAHSQEWLCHVGGIVSGKSDSRSGAVSGRVCNDEQSRKNSWRLHFARAGDGVESALVLRQLVALERGGVDGTSAGEEPVCGRCEGGEARRVRVSRELRVLPWARRARRGTRAGLDARAEKTWKHGR